MTYRLLIVEDNRDVARLLSEAVRDLADRVDLAHDGPTGLAMAESVDYALILLELFLPRLGGRKICQLLRSAGSDSSILAVTAHADAIAGALGAQHGFDDYMLKPFDLQEVREKSRVLLERRGSARPPLSASTAQQHHVTVDHAAKRVLVDGRAMEPLLSQEYELVSFLAQNRERSFSRSELMWAVWGIRHPIAPRHAGIDLLRLRQKLQPPGTPASYLRVSQDERYFLA